MSEETKQPYLDDKSYSVVRRLVCLWLPGLASAYFILSQVLDLPAADLVVGILVCTTFFLGGALISSTKRYLASEESYDGQMVVTEREDGVKLFSLELGSSPDAMELKDVIVFKVAKAS